MERQEKWARWGEIKFCKRIDGDCDGNFTVATKKSRRAECQTAIENQFANAQNSSARELPPEVVLAYIRLVASSVTPLPLQGFFMSTLSTVAAAAPSSTAHNIESVLKEKRVFKPSAKFAQAARLGSMKKFLKLH